MEKHCPLRAVWSGSALFSQTYQSENLGTIRKILFLFETQVPEDLNELISQWQSKSLQAQQVILDLSHAFHCQIKKTSSDKILPSDTGNISVKHFIFRMFFILGFYDIKFIRGNLAMLDAFLCKHHILKCFARMLNSRDSKFANISENKVLANKSESAVPFGVNNGLYLRQVCVLQLYISNALLDKAPQHEACLMMSNSNFKLRNFKFAPWSDAKFCCTWSWSRTLLPRPHLWHEWVNNEWAFTRNDPKFSDR